MEKLPSVLLIDDDTTNNFLNELLLQRLGVAERILVAESGTQALELLAQLPTAGPALILLDVNMPGLSGRQFLEAYRRQAGPPAGGPVVVMLTTSADPRDLGRLDELGVAGLLSKPLTPAKIHDLLHRHFGWPRPATTP